MAASGRPMHLHKWETFVQQNQLQINIDPDMIERYVESRIAAERAEIGAAAAISQNQVQTAAEAVVGCNRVQAEAALHVAAARTETEVTKVRAEAQAHVIAAGAEACQGSRSRNGEQSAGQDTQRGTRGPSPRDG